MTEAPAGRARPIIGISAYEEQARWTWHDSPAALLPATYVRAVERAGGLAVLVPVQELSPADASRLLGRLDGLVLSGGPDLDPARYGQSIHPEASSPRHERDAMESALLGAVTQRIPTLAICRGIQMLNVVRGGTLHQHLPDVVGHEGHSPIPHAFGRHPVRVDPDSLLGRVVGWKAADVPTHHHQGIAELGQGLTATAWADDGTIEAVEDRSVPFLVGVQWHPEAGMDTSLFEALVAAATGPAARAGERVGSSRAAP